MSNLVNPFIFSAGAPPAWAPTDVANLEIWCKNGTGYYQDAAKMSAATGTDPVGAWEDQSGNGEDLTQSTAGDRPVLNSGDVDFVSSDYLVGSTGFSLKPATIFFVAVWDSVSGNQRLLGGDTGAGLSLDSNGTSLRLLKQDVALIGTSSVTLATSTTYAIIVTYDGSGNYEFIVNGSSSGTGTNDQSISSVVPWFGAGSSGAYLSGQIKECGIYSAVLTGGDLTSLTTYLSGV